MGHDSAHVVQEVYDYKRREKRRFAVKGEHSMALVAILDGYPGACTTLSDEDKHNLLKAAVLVRVLL